MHNILTPRAPVGAKNTLISYLLTILEDLMLTCLMQFLLIVYNNLLSIKYFKYLNDKNNDIGN